MMSFVLDTTKQSVPLHVFVSCSKPQFVAPPPSENSGALAQQVKQLQEEKKGMQERMHMLQEQVCAQFPATSCLQCIYSAEDQFMQPVHVSVCALLLVRAPP